MSAAHVQAARRRMEELAAEAGRVVESKSMDLPRKKARMSAIELELKSLKSVIDVNRTANLLSAGRSAPGYPVTESGYASGFGAYGDLDARLAAYGSKSVNAVNPFRIDDGTLEQMHQAVVSHKSFRADIGTKAPADFQSDIPAQFGGTIPFVREPFRVASLFPNVGMSGPSLEYVRITGAANAAAPVTAGATKPTLGIEHDMVTATAVKIAALQDVVDETLGDFQSFAQVVSIELQRAIFAAENDQILNGTGTAPAMQGLLGVSGLLTEALDGNNLDTLEVAIEKLRTGSSYAEPDAVVMNPADWGAIRRAKASTSGVYLAVDPLSGTASTLWGCPVHVTTDIAQGTAVVGAFAMGGQVAVRESLRIDSDFGRSGTGFTDNVTTFRAEERIVLQVFRPSAFVLVTGLSAT